MVPTLFVLVCLFMWARNVHAGGLGFVVSTAVTPRASRIPRKLSCSSESDADWPENSLSVTGVTLKMAFDSQWGVADMSSQKSERFTSPESLDMVHRLRRCSDAVLVGRKTVEHDDCTLTIRRVPPFGRSQPIRVILDPQLSLKVDNYSISMDGYHTLIIFCHEEFSSQPSKKFPHIQYVGIAPDSEGRLSAQTIWHVLQENFSVRHLMVEGGPRTAQAFLSEAAVDRAVMVQAPVTFNQPLLSDVDFCALGGFGLDLVGEGMLGVDQVSYWTRPGLSWPTNSTGNWP